MLPASHLFKHLLIIVALALATAACDGPVGPQGDRGAQGPEGPTGQDGADGTDGERGARGPAGQDGEDGEDGARGPAGEDGNANVTLYEFSGHDFRDVPTGDGPNVQGCIPGVSRQEMHESAWLYYLVTGPTLIIYSVPGPGDPHGSTYRTFLAFSDVDCSNNPRWRIRRTTGIGGNYSHAIRIVRIEASNLVGGLAAGLRASPESMVPSDLDTSDYDAVVDYYGLTEDDIVRL